MYLENTKKKTDFVHISFSALLVDMLLPCYDFVVTRVYSEFGRDGILWKFSEFIRSLLDKTIYSEN